MILYIQERLTAKLAKNLRSSERNVMCTLANVCKLCEKKRKTKIKKKKGRGGRRGEGKGNSKNNFSFFGYLFPHW